MLPLFDSDNEIQQAQSTLPTLLVPKLLLELFQVSMNFCNPGHFEAPQTFTS